MPNNQTEELQKRWSAVFATTKKNENIEFDSRTLEKKAVFLSASVTIVFATLILFFYTYETVDLGDLGAALAAATSAVAFIWLYVSIKTQISELKEQTTLRRLSVAQYSLQTTTSALDLYAWEILDGLQISIPTRDNFDLTEAPYLVLKEAEQDDRIQNAAMGTGLTSVQTAASKYRMCYEETIDIMEKLDSTGILRHPFAHSVYTKVYEKLSA